MLYGFSTFFSTAEKSSSNVVSISLPCLSCLVTKVVFNWSLSSSLSVNSETCLVVPSNGVKVASVPLWVIFENW